MSASSQLPANSTQTAPGSPQGQGWDVPVPAAWLHPGPRRGDGGCGGTVRTAGAAGRLQVQAWREEWLRGGWHQGTAPPAPCFPAAQLINLRLSSGWRREGEQ